MSVNMSLGQRSARAAPTDTLAKVTGISVSQPFSARLRRHTQSELGLTAVVTQAQPRQSITGPDELEKQAQ
jgi:hypothetical protein